jgi:hypothetical protein
MTGIEVKARTALIIERLVASLEAQVPPGRLAPPGQARPLQLPQRPAADAEELLSLLLQERRRPGLAERLHALPRTSRASLRRTRSPGRGEVETIFAAAWSTSGAAVPSAAEASRGTALHLDCHKGPNRRTLAPTVPGIWETSVKSMCRLHEEDAS